ncbi:MAG: VWA containing CoxE family protein [Clostridiales Family XIII bacterium]|jgi:uncharacterized protein with von Willebrand factor type A (vWA) domain|nr:VWA containing CoxE family protein [Clostridiales Family XIII bacterium]
MFIAFYYLLRACGLKVSMNEWMTLTEALDRGLSGASLTGFYRLCRAVLVKTEADFDRFDLAFAEYFHGIESPETFPDELWRWLAEDVQIRDGNDKHMLDECLLELEELQRRLEERLKEQKERHSGGNYWIGTGGTSTMGHGGYHERGIRVGGEGRHRNAVQVAGERKFRDFRQDSILDARQFQMAFRKLRQYSSRLEGPRTELDIDETATQTGDNAGRLTLVWEKPRKNTIKLLVLFDSDGSMLPYGRLCNRLFHAVSKSSHFKDLKVYYFHNCVYEHLYKTPHCRKGEWIDTDWALKNLSQEYRLILVGDGTMAPSELLRKGGNSFIGLYNDTPGIEWLNRFRKRYGKSVWLNPIHRQEWDYTYGSHTLGIIKEIFPMFELTVDGLEAGIKKLLSGR